MNSNNILWSEEELGKLKLAISLYSFLDREKATHLHKHAIPYKSIEEIQRKSNELIKLSNNSNKPFSNNSPTLKPSTINQNLKTSPTLKSTVPINNLNNNNTIRSHPQRSESPSGHYWANN
ncbi:hypothetical protein RB653_002252 [Dictyostelium firmibasis]|uniref:Myb-like domain-containing protein n=1 Tax=Dictyostelium firmibasis TaxID=79012 RepID=A0AAN7YSG1_9MYCE